MDIGAFFTFCFLPLFFFFMFGYFFGAVAHLGVPHSNRGDNNDDNTFFYTAMWMDD
jgi:hypothetical protein